MPSVSLPSSLPSTIRAHSQDHTLWSPPSTATPFTAPSSSLSVCLSTGAHCPQHPHLRARRDALAGGDGAPHRPRDTRREWPPSPTPCVCSRSPPPSARCEASGKVSGGGGHGRVGRVCVAVVPHALHKLCMQRLSLVASVMVALKLSLLLLSWAPLRKCLCSLGGLGIGAQDQLVGRAKTGLLCRVPAASSSEVSRRMDTRRPTRKNTLTTSISSWFGCARGV